MTAGVVHMQVMAEGKSHLLNKPPHLMYGLLYDGNRGGWGLGRGVI